MPYAALLARYSLAPVLFFTSDLVKTPELTTPESVPVQSRRLLIRSRIQDGWFVAQSASFFVCSKESAAAAEATVRQAEETRAQLMKKWFGQLTPKPWAPRCQIVVHRERKSYGRAVGPGGEATVGSSAVTIDGKRISARRIDLLHSDSQAWGDALPHELTHIILRDRFAQGTLPRWAEEGMALLADSEVKQRRHIDQLRAAVARGEEFFAGELLSLPGYPAASRRQTFYGQSIFLTQLLIERKDPTRFVEFLELAQTEGCDVALRKCYGLADAGDLDRHWRRSLYAAQ